MRFESKPESIFFVGVTGGSCAGKSMFAQRLRDALGIDYCQILSEDSYYHDGGAINFHDPNSIDFELMYEQLLQLHRGEPIRVPIYDFATHRRLTPGLPMYPADIILIEGSLILTQPFIVELLTESIFIDALEAIRLERRIKRDMVEHGRTLDSILAQFHNQVKPMHERYIEPIKRLATYQIADETTSQAVIDDIVDKLGIDS